MRALNLGCGEQVVNRPGWVNADAEPRKDGVVKADAYALPFEDGTFDLVMTNHVLEHLADVPKALAEQRRVLKPGGEVLACIPDMDHEEEWIGAHLGEIARLSKLGSDGAGHQHVSNMNQAGLEAALRAAGFEDVREVATTERWELTGKMWWQAAARGRKAVLS